MGITDSHAHICGEELFPRFDEVVQGAREAGVDHILIVCTEVAEARRALKVAEGSDMFDVAAAFYPNDVARMGQGDWAALEELVKDPGIAAVGEIGMDFFSDEVPKDLQEDCLVRQIHWANRLCKPVLIHSRLATADTTRILRAHLRVPGIMHCYSGGFDAMQAFLDLGMYLSFSGNITFEDDPQTTQAVRRVPLDRILVETDAPSLSPAPVRHLPNEPKFIVHVLDRICALRGCTRQELETATAANYRRLFRQCEERKKEQREDKE